MKKYELYEYHKEFTNRKKDKTMITGGCTYGYDGDSSPELIKSFDSLEDAKIYMNKHCIARVDRVGSTCWDLLEVYEYFIFKADYDDDGEEIDSENNYDPLTEMLIPDNWEKKY